MAGDEPDSKKAKPVLDPQTMSSKQYLDSLVVPHLLPALNAVSTNRPQDPIQYLVRNKVTNIILLMCCSYRQIIYLRIRRAQKIKIQRLKVKTEVMQNLF